MQSQGKLCLYLLVKLQLNTMRKTVNNVKIHGLIILIASNLSNNYEKESSSQAGMYKQECFSALRAPELKH